jgi:uncharacterized protein (DUF983 family)
MRGKAATSFHPAARPPLASYRLGASNWCPGCNGRNFHIGRKLAECARCGTAMPIANLQDDAR